MKNKSADLREFDGLGLSASGIHIMLSKRTGAIEAVGFDEALVKRGLSVDGLVCQIVRSRIKEMRAGKRSLVRALAKRAGIRLAAISQR